MAINSPNFASPAKNKAEWWEPIAEALDSLSLRSLRIVCPRCRKTGLIITRWVKGPPSKPLYVLHAQSGKETRICELNEEQCSKVRGQVRVYESDIRKLLRSKRPFVLFSGGKDSLATFAYLRALATGSTHPITAIYVDTTAGIAQNMRYVRRVAKYLGLRLKIVRPKIDYFTLARDWGIPSFRYRWCCRELKIKPIQQYLATIKEPKVVFDGIRAAESYIRRQYIPIWYHPSFHCLSVSPIFHWSDRRVISFINRDGIPKTLLHSMGTSTECWCGAYKTESDFRRLYDLDRNLFYKLARLEEESKTGYTFLYKRGERMSLSGLEKDILAESKWRKNSGQA